MNVLFCKINMVKILNYVKRNSLSFMNMPDLKITHIHINLGYGASKIALRLRQLFQVGIQVGHNENDVCET